MLENEKSIEQAAQLVIDTAEKGFGVVVVVSAMKGVTDQLIALSKKVDPEMEACADGRAPRLRREDQRPADGRRARRPRDQVGRRRPRDTRTGRS